MVGFSTRSGNREEDWYYLESVRAMDSKNDEGCPLIQLAC